MYLHSFLGTFRSSLHHSARHIGPSPFNSLPQPLHAPFPPRSTRNSGTRFLAFYVFLVLLACLRDSRHYLIDFPPFDSETPISAFSCKGLCAIPGTCSMFTHLTRPVDVLGADSTHINCERLSTPACDLGVRLSVVVEAVLTVRFCS